MRLAVIPARGGSKRIPRKNIKPFAGRPIIAWSIDAARESGCFDKIIVSTDDPEIADVARAFGAETPFLRAQDISGDMAGTIPVIAHATQYSVSAGWAPELVCCIYATAPFVRASDLRAGLALLQDTGVDYTFSVTNFSAPIQRALRLAPDGSVAMFAPDERDSRSQDLVEAYHDAGQFYWGQAGAWLAERPVFGASSRALVLPRYRVQDIDTPDDWRRAELMFNALSELGDGEPE